MWMERAIGSFSKERQNDFVAVYDDNDDTESLIKAFLSLRELSTASGRGVKQPRKTFCGTLYFIAFGIWQHLERHEILRSSGVVDVVKGNLHLRNMLPNFDGPMDSASGRERTLYRRQSSDTRATGSVLFSPLSGGSLVPRLITKRRRNCSDKMVLNPAGMALRKSGVRGKCHRLVLKSRNWAQPPKKTT